MMKQALTVLSAIALALVVSTPALAIPIVFSGTDSGAGAGDPSPGSDAAYAAWKAALMGAATTVIDFESGDGGAVLSGEHAAESGLRSSDVTELGYNTTPGGDTHFAVWPTFGFTSASVTWAVAPGTNAWGGWFTGLEEGFTGSVTINYTSGGPVSIDVPENPGMGGGVSFLGFVDLGADIASITLTETGVAGASERDIWGVDDIEYGRVPEPGTLALIGLGLIGLAARRRI